VAGDDLSSITGMEDKHRRALARRQITTLRDLADADRHVIYRAMGSIKPRPTLSQIGRWQDEARGRLDEAQDEAEAPGGDQARGEDKARSQPYQARGQPDEARGEDEARSQPEEPAGGTEEWHPVASFAVVFARRRDGETWERRIEAERTEVEPEREPEVWPGWECGPLCGWMLGQAGGTGPGERGQDGGGQAQRTEAGPAGSQPAGEPAGAGGGRPQLRIDSAAITDAAGTSDLVTDGAPVTNPPAGLVAPALVAFTVSGARRGTEVQAVARLRGHGEPGRNVTDPVTVPTSGPAEFDLTQVAAGQLEMTLLAWAPDCTARHVSVSLPAMRISRAPDEGPGEG
jgi:hypothetical protein